MDIEQLKNYNSKTTDTFGIIMPTIEEFDNKIKIAISLWPQINKNGGIDYLFGKGVGVELALRGEVNGRVKNYKNFPYRSHSDFEIYDSLGYEQIPESSSFVYVFGGQEIYPKTQTKGLACMESDLMDSTYDVVTYQGNTYLIPCLEILFLDKYMKRESTPRQEGYDAFLLMQEYKLNIDLLREYFHKYIQTPALETYMAQAEKMYDRQLQGLTKRIFDATTDTLEEDNIVPTFEKQKEIAMKKLNKWKALSKRAGIDYISHNVTMSLCPDELEFIQKEDGTIDISDKNKQEIKEKIEESKVNKVIEYDNQWQEIENYYYTYYPEERKSNSSPIIQ